MAVIKAGDFHTGCRAVLFDKDGTLIDFKNMWLVWIDYVFNALIKRYQLTKKIIAQFEEAVGVSLVKRWIDPGGAMASGSMAAVRDSIADCLACHGVDLAEARDTFIAVVKASETEVDWPAITYPVPGLEEVLRKLEEQGVKMAVVTADTTRRAENTLAFLGLSSYFQAVVGADRVKNTKPEPDMALLACELLGVEPREAVVVGDNVTDMCMGEKAGLAGKIGVLTGVCLREQLEAVADAVVDSVAEMEIE